MRFLSERLYVLTTMGVRERLLRFIKARYGSGPVIHSDHTKKQTAAAIGVRPETLSRALRALENEGLLTWRGKTITFQVDGT
jgi:CRP/FNR family transcriptional regulator